MQGRRDRNRLCRKASRRDYGGKLVCVCREKTGTGGAEEEDLNLSGPEQGKGVLCSFMGDTFDIPDVREFLSDCMQGRDTGADGCSRKERANKNSFIHMAGTASSKAVFFYTGRYLCRSEYSFIRKRKWHPETGCQEEGADQNWV